VLQSVQKIAAQEFDSFLDNDLAGSKNCDLLVRHAVSKK